MMWLRGIVASLFCMFAAICAIYGIWQIALGRNMPGILGWGYLPRHGPKKSAAWKPLQWRRNGVFLLVLAAVLALLGHNLLAR